MLKKLRLQWDNDHKSTSSLKFYIKNKINKMAFLQSRLESYWNVWRTQRGI